MHIPSFVNQIPTEHCSQAAVYSWLLVGDFFLLLFGAVEAAPTDLHCQMIVFPLRDNPFVGNRLHSAHYVSRPLKKIHIHPTSARLAKAYLYQENVFTRPVRMIGLNLFLWFCRSTSKAYLYQENVFTLSVHIIGFELSSWFCRSFIHICTHAYLHITLYTCVYTCIYADIAGASILTSPRPCI